jgi:hypothetical protein
MKEEKLIEEWFLTDFIALVLQNYLDVILILLYVDALSLAPWQNTITVH